MTENDAQDWLAKRVPRGTIDKCARFVMLLREEMTQQNLISSASADAIWSRHIVDSAQLLDHVPAHGRWIDLGSGAGLPGVIVGLTGGHGVTLTESRSKRIAYLERTVAALGLSERVAVRGGRIETMSAEPFDIISARAFAPLDRLFASALHLSGPGTRWVLPKGRSAREELDAARRTWQGDFSIVPSITDSAAAIVIAENVRPRDGGRDWSRR